MMYLNGITDVSETTEIVQVKPVWIRTFGSESEKSLTWIGGTVGSDYWNNPFTSNSNDPNDVEPWNIKYLEVKYNDGSGEKVTQIPANMLHFTGSSDKTYYTIESRNDNVHIVSFWNETNASAADQYDLYAVRFVEHNQNIGENNMPSEPVYSATDYKFVNWEINGYYGRDGESFLATTVVDADMNVYAHKVSSEYSGGTEIRIMNNYQGGTDLFLKRLVEGYNEKYNQTITVEQIEKSSVKVRVNGAEGKHTNEYYYSNDWNKQGFGNDYYLVHNFDAPGVQGGIDSHQNTHVGFNEVSGIVVYFSLADSTEVATIEIPVGNNTGDLAKMMYGVGADHVLQLYVIQQGDVIDGPDDNKPEPPDDKTLFELLENAVTIDCTNDAANHDSKTYDLLEGSFDKGEVQGNDQDGYTFTVTVNPDLYVEKYNNDIESVHHLDPADQASQAITLKKASANGSWTVDAGATPVTFTVKCDEPTPATYSLKYDANGGTFANTNTETADVNNLVAGEYKLWAKDQSVSDDKQPTNETAWPTHAKDNDTDVIMIGWTAEKDTKIYAKGDTEPNVITTATITDADVTVYAVWGYDTNENGTPDVEEDWYTLTYDANGGDETSVPVDTNLYQTDKVTLASTPVPTHAQDNEKDVVFIGWSNTQTNKIFAAGEDYGSLVDKVTFVDSDITVYAVWGYDEYGNGPDGGDGIPDAQQVVIYPADITVYTGGDGYTGVLNENGETVGETENGLPEPGYYFILPYELNAMFGADPDEMVDLTKHLRLNYSNGDDKRSWTLQMYNANDGVKPEDNIANEKYVYRLVPDKDDNSARLEIHDGKDTITSDNAFDFALTTLYKEYTMNLYTETVKQSLVKVEYNESGIDNDWQEASDIKGIALGTATLAVRGTSLDNPVTDINDEVNSPVNSITAEQPSNVTYYTNGSIIPVVNQDKVQLLVDDIVEDAQNTLKDAIVKEANSDSNIDITDEYTFEFNYLDLVDTSNGNAYVTMGANQKMTLFWPYPDNMDANDTYYIAHFNGLDRNYDDLDAALADTSTSVDIYSENSNDLKLEKTDEGIKITTSSFSPFALVYDADQGSGTNPGGGGSTGGGTTPNPPALNTEDHFSYVVGYEDGMVKPENAITRAEVASIFYRLLKDDVRDANTTDVSEFSDVSASDWYGTTVATLSAMDIVRGYEDGTFRPNAPITRAEFAAIATRFFEETGAEYEPGTFDDVTGDEWFANAIADAVELGLIGGYPDGTVLPNNNITRAEACAVVNRTLGRIPHVDHLLPVDEMKTWPDNHPSDWFYADMQEATNGHEYEWTKEDGQKVEEWTAILDKDWEDR